MIKEYKINNIEDFTNVPDDRLDDCLIDFKQYIILLKEFKKEDKNLKSEFIWIDDGEHKIKEIIIDIKK